MCFPKVFRLLSLRDQPTQPSDAAQHQQGITPHDSLHHANRILFGILAMSMMRNHIIGFNLNDLLVWFILVLIHSPMGFVMIGHIVMHVLRFSFVFCSSFGLMRLYLEFLWSCVVLVKSWSLWQGNWCCSEESVSIVKKLFCSEVLL